MALRRAWLASALVVMTAGLARAQDHDDSINLHHLYVPLDGHGLVVTDGARTLRQLQVHVGAGVSHARRPLELGRPGDRRLHSLVRELSVVDLVASVGLLDGLSLGVHVPVVVQNDGKELFNPSSDTRNGGLGAVRLQLKWTFVETEQFALAVKPFVTLPTGRARDYLSDNENPTYGAMLVASADLGRVRLTGEVGFEDVSADIDLGDVDIDARLRFAVGVEVFLLQPALTLDEGHDPDHPADHHDAPSDQPHALSLGAELFGWTTALAPFHDEREHPMEALAFLRYRQEDWGLVVTAAGGGGLNNGLGAPDHRLVLSVGWTWR